jgi:alanine-synthesizing transaminase
MYYRVECNGPPLVKFSSRLNWETGTNRLSELLHRKRQSGRAILDLTESNPTRAGLAYPADLAAALADPQALKYQPDPRGIASAREAVSRYYAGAAPVSRILLTASTSEAYSHLFKLLADAGDEVLVPRPSYPLFEFLAHLDSVRVRQYPLRYDGAWHIDFPSLELGITPRTRAIVLVNPNNPTGSFVRHSELERLETYGLPLIADEVFSDYAFDACPSCVRTLAGGRNVLTFSMSGLSKIAGLPQMKLGWIVASGPGCEEAIDRLELIADTYLSVATPVQLALPALLESDIGDQIRRRTSSNLTFLRDAVRESALHLLNVEGGWYATLQVPRNRSEEEWSLELLEKHDVLVQPGFFFDFESEAFLVLSLLTPAEIFNEGLRRILNVVR